MTRWTKKDITTLCSCISSFWVTQRPIPSTGWGQSPAEKEFPAAFTQILESSRRLVILTELGNRVTMYQKRVEEYKATAKHFEVNPQVYGKSTPEMIDRFNGYALEEEKSLAWVKKLMDKVANNDLPTEVMSFNPEKKP